MTSQAPGASPPRTYNLVRFLGAALALWLAFPAGSLAGGIDIAPHRAAYVLKLKSAAPGSNIVDATGGMIYVWADTCDGWAVEQRYLLHVVRNNLPGIEMNATSVTWESKDGLRYRFNVKRKRNGKLTADVRGEAQLSATGKSGSVRFDKPQSKTLKLPAGTVFPTMHTLKLMEKALAGGRMDRQLLFDGSEVESSNPVSAFILPPREGPKDAVLKPLGPMPVRRMNLAFFDPASGEAEPEFEMSIDMQDNGVVPRLLFDYGEFQITGTIAKIEALAKSGC